MKELFLRIRQQVGQMFGYLWAYGGTLAVLALLIGVLGVGILYTAREDDASTLSAAEGNYRYFTGVYNVAAASVPVGIGLLPVCSAPGGTEHIRFEYAADGKLKRLVYVGTDGVPRAMPGSLVAEQRVRYDGAGNVIEKSNFDAGGKPVADASGVATRLYEYDSAGHLVRSVMRAADGTEIVPRMPGYAEKRISYDSQGRPVRILFLDGAGKPVTNAIGECDVRFLYNESGLSQRRVNLINGATADNANGIAIEKKSTTSDGAVTQTRWMNAAGAPVVHPGVGAHAVLEEHTPADKMKRTRYYDAGDSLFASPRTHAEHVVRTDSADRTEWECYRGADGLPCNNAALGYAERVCEYGNDGALRKEFFWDAVGNPAPCYEKRYIEQGGARYELALLADGSTRVRRLEPSENQAL
ncbi:MAG: hypothetical protein IJA63_00915 [Akkermansia sp.]|nr:hypothetical protein [Akkermansia sp.]